MDTLIIVSHPNPQSLTHAVAAEIAHSLPSPHTAKIADLTAEGFDPRITAADIAVNIKAGQPPADVLAEQQRLARADALVLVYPVYWWSFPALLKGWIERVFTQGWAYEEHANGTLVKKLGHLPVHLVALGGATLRTYARHGYCGAMRTQIEHGIFDYCGAPVASSTLLLASDDGYPDSALASARDIGRRIPEMLPSALSLPAPLLQRQQ